MTSVRSKVHSFRRSTGFIVFVISFAVFTDQFLYAAIVPVVPFSLQGQVPESRIQFWTAILLAVFGIGCFVFSGMTKA